MDNIDIHPIHCCESACENSINFDDEKSLDNLVLSICTRNLSQIALNAFAHDNSRFSEYSDYIIKNNKMEKILPLKQQRNRNVRDRIDTLHICAHLPCDWSV